MPSFKLLWRKSQVHANACPWVLCDQRHKLSRPFFFFLTCPKQQHLAIGSAPTACTCIIMLTRTHSLHPLHTHRLTASFPNCSKCNNAPCMLESSMHLNCTVSQILAGRVPLLLLLLQLLLCTLCVFRVIFLGLHYR